MPKYLNRIVSTFLALIICFSAKAQEVEMADGMRANGKIYVVVAVLTIVLAGVFLYLINIDRKITKLEKENK